LTVELYRNPKRIRATTKPIFRPGSRWPRNCSTWINPERSSPFSPWHVILPNCMSNSADVHFCSTDPEPNFKFWSSL